VSAQTFKRTQPPVRVPAVPEDKAHPGKFDPQWESWFLDVWRLLKAITTALPVSTAFAGSYVGGGTPFTQTTTIITQAPAYLYITANIIHGYIAATSPGWQLQIKLDGTVIEDTGSGVAVW